MFYAAIRNTEAKTFRFYSKAERDLFVSETADAESIAAKAAKFVPGSDRCVTYSGKTASGSWCRV